MRAAVLRAAGGALAVEDVADPVPGSGEVVVRVRACGLGLTLAWNRDGRSRQARLPRIIGHEIAGDVEVLGPDVREVAPGDRVSVYYYLTCGTCPSCLAGRDNLCEQRGGSIGREIDGGLAELVRLPARNLVPIPTGLGYVAAAIAADAVATPVHLLQARARVEAGETVLVIGAGGGVGIHAVQLAVILGARVLAADVTPSKLALAREAGADAVIDAATEALDAAVARLTDGRGADVILDFVGRSETLAQAAASLSANGRLVLVGSYDRAAVLAIDHGTLRGDAAILASQYCTRADLAEALRLLAEGRIRPVVSRTCRLEKADAVLREIEAMAVPGRACVVFD